MIQAFAYLVQLNHKISGHLSPEAKLEREKIMRYNKKEKLKILTGKKKACIIYGCAYDS